MLLPIKSKNPPESLPIATLLLIFTNCVIFAFTCSGLMIKAGVAQKYGLTYDNLSPKTLISSIFLHGDIFHLLGNMWFLYILGFAVEGRLRTPKFLLVYFVSGLAGDFLHTFTFGVQHPDIPTIGASGAIMGVLGAALYMFPFGQVDIFYWFGYWFHGVFTWPMWGIGLLYLGMDLLMAFLMGSAGGGVAHLAHLGGAGGGFFACMILRPRRDNREASDAKATLSEVKDYSVLTPFELANMAQSNPNDTRLILAWMSRSMRDGKVIQNCHDAFMGMLPQIIQREPAQEVGWVLANMSTTPGFVKPHILLNVATKLEAGYDFLTALRLYDSVLRDPASAAADREAALFRSSLICETAINNPQRALHGYQEVMRLFPMGAFAEQARMRHAAMMKRIT